MCNAEATRESVGVGEKGSVSVVCGVVRVGGVVCVSSDGGVFLCPSSTTLLLSLKKTIESVEIEHQNKGTEVESV
jgi:hypothetical protein